MFFHSITSLIVITLAGHSFAHFPHPTHLSESILALIPLQIAIAFNRHTLTQQPQATQWFSFTVAFRLFLILVSIIISLELRWSEYSKIAKAFPWWNHKYVEFPAGRDGKFDQLVSQQRNYRAHLGTFRYTFEWDSRYKIYTTVKRSINHFKDCFVHTACKTQNEKMLHVDMLLFSITQHIFVVHADKILKHQFIRSFKSLIAMSNASCILWKLSLSEIKVIICRVRNRWKTFDMSWDFGYTMYAELLKA